MSAKQSVLGRVDARREVRRPPLVGMEFLHQPAMGSANVVSRRYRLQAKDLISLLVRHFAVGRSAAVIVPPCRVALRVLTPGGKPAVKIRFK